MSSHPNRVPQVEVWRVIEGEWRWACWDDDCRDFLYATSADRSHDTHAEALAADLAHCKEASK